MMTKKHCFLNQFGSRNLRVITLVFWSQNLAVLVLVLLYLLFWFLVDRTVHFHYCIILPIIFNVLFEKKWIVLLLFITVMLFLLYLVLLFSKTKHVRFISTGFIIGTYLRVQALWQEWKKLLSSVHNNTRMPKKHEWIGKRALFSASKPL